MRTRLYLDSRLDSGGCVAAGNDAVRHLGWVLRMKRGDTLSVFNERDGEYAAKIVERSRDGLRLELAGRLVDPAASGSDSPLRLHLAQGLSRGERMNVLVQKTTELGVSRITPVLTCRGVVKLDAARRTSRQAHWRRIAIHAAEQCGRLKPPAIDLPVAFGIWLERLTQSSEAPSRWLLDPRASIDDVRAGAAAGGLCLLVGPEGGFTDHEYAEAAAAGFVPVSLGPRVLRTETAGITAVALAQAEFGDLRRRDRR